jgi:hypothetical protein
MVIEVAAKSGLRRILYTDVINDYAANVLTELGFKIEKSKPYGADGDEPKYNYLISGW